MLGCARFGGCRGQSGAGFVYLLRRGSGICEGRCGCFVFCEICVDRGRGVELERRVESVVAVERR